MGIKLRVTLPLHDVNKVYDEVITKGRAYVVVLDRRPRAACRSVASVGSFLHLGLTSPKVRWSYWKNGQEKYKKSNGLLKYCLCDNL